MAAIWPQRLDEFHWPESTMREVGLILYAMARMMQATATLEIGTGRGYTSIMLGGAALENGGLHFTIDNSASPETWVDGEEPTIHFQRVCKDLGLEKHVVIMKGDSAKIFWEEQSFDLIFVDGDHSYQGVKADIEHIEHRVKFGGILAFDDYFLEPGVARAVSEWQNPINWEQLIIPYHIKIVTDQDRDTGKVSDKINSLAIFRRRM